MVGAEVHFDVTGQVQHGLIGAAAGAFGVEGDVHTPQTDVEALLRQREAHRRVQGGQRVGERQRKDADGGFAIRRGSVHADG